MTSVGTAKDDAIAVREFVADDLDAFVAFSLRAWEPVFTSLHAVLGDEIFFRLHPDWCESKAEAVRSACTSDERDVFVAVVDAQPVGFVAVALNAFHDRMWRFGTIIGRALQAENRIGAGDAIRVAAILTLALLVLAGGAMGGE